MDNNNSNNNNDNNNNGNGHSQAHQAPFWDWVRSMEDYQQSRPRAGQSNAEPRFDGGFQFDANTGFGGFGPWSGPWSDAWWQRHQRFNNHNRDDAGDEEPRVEEATDTDTATKDVPEDRSTHPPPPPPPQYPQDPQDPQDPFHPPRSPPPPPHHHGRGRHHHGPPPPFGPPRGRGGRCGRGGRRHHYPPPPQYSGPFDFAPLMHALSTHPFAQTWRNYAHQYRDAPTSHAPQHEGQTREQQDEAFSPPVDIFSNANAYVLHVALPGVSKEDISVNWDGEKVTIAGVAYRPGSEEFLSTLVSGERSVGMFERKIKLPPSGSNDNEDVDGYGITAKMENGILIVTVPKTEKDWTEVHKVEIE